MERKPTRGAPGMRELRLHTNGTSGSTYISGEARMTVFVSVG